MNYVTSDYHSAILVYIELIDLFIDDIAKIVQNDPGLICVVFPENELFSSWTF
jgi:hypothetical protein